MCQGRARSKSKDEGIEEADCMSDSGSILSYGSADAEVRMLVESSSPSRRRDEFQSCLAVELTSSVQIGGHRRAKRRRTSTFVVDWRRPSAIDTISNSGFYTQKGRRDERRARGVQRARVFTNVTRGVSRETEFSFFCTSQGTTVLPTHPSLRETFQWIFLCTSPQLFSSGRVSG